MPRCIFVPTTITEGTLSAECLGAIAWILAQNEERIKPSELKKRFGWGDTVWRRVSRELREHKLLSTLHTRQGTELRFHMESDINA